MTDTTMSDWTKKWGKAHNENRKKRRAEDPDYLARHRAQSRETARKKRAAKAGRLYKNYNGVDVEVFRSAKMLEATGLTDARARYWRDKGLWPESVFSGKQAFYTRNQISAIKGGFDLMENSSMSFEDVQTFIAGKWKEGLPNGDNH
ncbi:MAG: MerR family transcriptional regulator [Gammaproteobacteria bacterium]|nr:MerR family transcriptional regulator [Gammaproteobacteria bacterium]